MIKLRCPLNEKSMKIERQIQYLLRPNISERFKKLYQKGLSIPKIAKGCGVSNEAIRLTFSNLDFGKRKVRKEKEDIK